MATNQATNNVQHRRFSIRDRLRRGASLAVLTAGLATTASGAWAQAGRATTAGNDVEEVVVTAQLRTESLQDVPLAITAIGGRELQRSQVTSLSDIQYLAAGITFRPGSAPDYKIRGVGTQTFDYAIESSVGLVIDEVAQGLPRSPNLSTLADVSQIEVLRGPQGTLFGRNASAGLISVTTNRPVPKEFQATGKLSYGSRNEVIANASINVPFSDTLTGRFTGGLKHRDGFINNVFNNTKIYETDESTINAKLMWEPNDRFRAYVIGDMQRVKNNSATIWTVRQLAPGPSVLRDRLAVYGIVPGPKNLDVALDGPNYQDIYLRGVTVNLSYELGDLLLTSISAFRELSVRSQLELDSSDLPRFNTNLATQSSRQRSQEFRITSPTGKFLDYVAGLYYIEVDNDVTQDQWGTLDLAPVTSPRFAGGVFVSGNRGRLVYDTDNRSYAAYANVTANVSERLKMFAGARITDDRVYSLQFVRQIPNVCQTSYIATGICQPTPFPSPQNLRIVNNTDWLGKVGIKYDFSDSIMGYVSVARGYKGPTVNNVSGAATLVRPETNLAYEVGVKSRLFDDRLTFNIDVFKTHFKNFQTQTYDTNIVPFGFILGNAGGMESRGVEFEVVAKVTDKLRLSGNAAYVDTYFTDYQLFCNVGTCKGMNNKFGVFTPRLFDAKGLSPVNAPKFTYNLTAQYRTSLSETLDFDAHANWAWRSKAIGSVGDPNTVFDPYGLLNVNLGVSEKDDKWRVGLFARNVFDKYYVAGFIATTLNTGGYSNVPDGNGGGFRTIGIVFDVKM